ncbi:MAG TPA: Glu/Leu/Phe/Val dehydrogenase [Candidatus Nanoarchaeia archaeon]
MIKHDHLGPEKLIEIYDQETKMRGFLVIDNTWLGVAKGGLRMTPGVTLEEIFHLARVMTYKNALAELPFGGGKSGIIADVKNISLAQKFELIRSFSRAIKLLCPSLYIAGPDVGTGGREIAEFVRANGSLKSATGKPADMCIKPGEECGLPHEFGSTGFGVVQAVLAALGFLGQNIEEMSVAIAGSGNVGSFVTSLLAKEKAKIVAISDSGGTTYNPKGLEVRKIFDIKKKKGSVSDNPDGEKLSSEDITALDVDILIPAAFHDAVNAENVNKVKAKLIVEAANLAVRPDAEVTLYKKGVLVVPDIVANAGGVISSYAEYRGYNPKQMFKLVERKIERNVGTVLGKSKAEKITPRQAALKIARERLQRARNSKE